MRSGTYGVLACATARHPGRLPHAHALRTFVSGVIVLVVVLVAGDARVRQRASTLIGGGHAVAGLTDIGARVADLVGVTVQVARVWASAHTYLAIFAVAAVVQVTAVLRL